MRFPEEARTGSEAHADAVRRLDDARDRHRERSDALDRSRDTSGEPAAAIELSAAREKVAAGEAWVSWVERGY